ncbi:MAG: hypothetical protein J2O44_06625, partial [Porphyrobacter sp.]|nr:hypothetical protein [Porphyrobacter sp.]
MAANVTVVTMGTPQSMTLGDNTTEAKRQADISTGAAGEAVTSAAVAQAAAGPNYASIAAGNAATVAGQAFAVDNGDGTVSVYPHGAAVAGDVLRKLIKDPAASTAAALIGTASGQKLQAWADGVVWVTPDDARYAAYGDINDPMYAAAVINAALLDCEATGKCLAIPKRYPIKRPIAMRNCIVEARDLDATFQNTLTAAEIAANTITPEEAAAGLVLNTVHQTTINFSGYHPIYLPKAEGLGFGAAGCNGTRSLTWVAGNAVQAGQPFFVCTNPADAAAFTAGKGVLVRDSLYHSQYQGTPPHTNELPLTHVGNIVDDAGGDPATGIVPLKFAIPEGFAASLIALADNPINPNTGLVTTDIYGVPLYMVQRGRLIGIGLESDEFEAMNYGLAVGCELYLPNVVTDTFGLNGFHNSIVEAHVKARRRPFEMAMGSSCNRFTITGSFEHDGTSTAQTILFGENVVGNEGIIDLQIKGAPAVSSASLIYFAAARRNKVTMRGKASGYFDSQIAYVDDNPNADGHDPTQSNPLTSDNEVIWQMDDSDATPKYGVNFTHATTQADGKSSQRDNIVRGRIRATSAGTYATDVHAVGGFKGLRPQVYARFDTAGPVTFVSSGCEDAAFDIEGNCYLANYNLYGRSVSTSARIGGISQPAKQVAISTSSTSYAPDFSIPDAAVTLTGASMALMTPVNVDNNSRVRRTFINGTGGTSAIALSTA